MTGNEIRKGVSLSSGTEWTVNPSTGIITLSEDALQQIINPDPIEKWYTLDQEPLARGQFAVVYHCCHRVTGVEYAAKFSSRWRFGTDCVEDLLHEIAVCALLGPHTQAVQLIDVFSTAREFVLVMEYAAGGDLQTLLDEELVPYEHDVVSFIRQLLDGLVVIHDKNLVHLDIKPQNLVLMGEFPECEVKLCDFEISRMLTKGHDIREILGTPDYVAPEILHYEPITASTDMWSVGVLTYVLLTGFLPFGGENDQETFMEISKCELDFPSQLFEDITPEAIDFMKKLLIRQPELRMSANESLMHSWIRSKVKRPTPPNTLNLAYINTPALPVEVEDIPEPVHTYAERSISCPLSDNSDSPKENRNENMFPLNIRPTICQNTFQKTFTENACVSATPLTTTGNLLTSPFFQKSELRSSRQNLERLKSMSKSREVLSGKIQMSNLKKCQSKSRERIIEAKLGFSKSRDRLMALRSLSQSVEGLSVLSRLQQASNLCSSYNNIFNHNGRLNINEEQRMYQSLASIDQIDKNKNLVKNHYDSTVSLNTEIYNDLLTKRNTDINCKLLDINYESPKQTVKLKPSVCKGGRDVCGSKCTNSPKLNSDHSQRANKSSERQKREISKTNKDRKTSDKSERVRDKRRRPSSTTGGQKIEKSSSGPITATPLRRGSVSHVEQRLLERHERQQERKQKEKNITRRKSASDYERTTTLQKSKLNKSADKISTSTRKATPRLGKKRNKPSESPFSSDVSQATSLESVDKPISSPDLPSHKDMFIVPVVTVTEDYEPLYANIKQSCEKLISKTHFPIEPDIFCCSNMDANLNAVDLGKSQLPSKRKDEQQDKKNISVSERIQNFEKVSTTATSFKQQQPFATSIPVHNPFVGVERLGIISEEDNMSDKSDSRLELYRTVSNSSELGSLSSNSSEVDSLNNTKGKEDSSLSSEVNHININNHNVKNIGSERSDVESFVRKTNSIFSDKDLTDQLTNLAGGIINNVGKNRTRSFSVYSTACEAPKNLGRSRSKSFNLNNPPGMPWGTLCNGVVARAFEKLNFTESDISPSVSPRNSSPILLSPVTD